MNSVFHNLPILFGMPADGPSLWDPVIGDDRSQLDGFQLTDEREPLYFDNRLNPLSNPSEVFGGDIPQNVYGKLNPALSIAIRMFTGKNSFGQDVSRNPIEAISDQFPGTGDNPVERLRSFLPPASTDPMDWSKYILGRGVDRVGQNEQMAVLKEQNQTTSAKVGQLNREAQAGGLKVEHVNGKWRVVRVDPDTGNRINDKIVGTFASPGDAQRYVDDLLKKLAIVKSG
jgi:hypothetical protein